VISEMKCDDFIGGPWDLIKRVIADMEEVLSDALEYFEDRQDADCEGDPLEFVPNKEMNMASRICQVIEDGKQP
jgi:hypothetical protein